MNVVAKIISTEKFSFQGKQFVKLQGFINGLGLFQQTVKEEMIPDVLEGRECVLKFCIGLSNFKPYLKINGISLDTSLAVSK